MVALKVEDFGGRAPSRSKRLLPPNYGQEASNVKLLSGELRGLRAPRAVHTLPAGTNPARVWRVQRQDDPAMEYWVTSQYREAELVKCPLLDDAYDRWYLFEPGQPAKVLTTDDMANGTGPWNLNFTAPTTPPTLTPTVVDTENVRDVVYVYTYVTEWGEESAPSPPATVSVDDAGSVVVSGFYTPTPVIEGRDFAKVRIYRTISFFGSAALFYVGEVDWGVDSYNDTDNDAIVSLNETLSITAGSTAVDGMFGARVHPSGALVAVKDQTVYFSEPYRPHVWTESYETAVADTIVGIEVFEQNVAVMTTGRPVLLYGATPAQIGILKFSFAEPCISYNSIVGAPEGAYYASHQGLVLFTAVGPSNITRSLIAKEEWEKEYLNETLYAVRYGTQYMGFERPGLGFIIDTLDQRISLTDITFSDPALVGFEVDTYTGDVYVFAGDDIFLWDPYDGEEVDYVWKSKQVILPKPVNMGAVKVHLEPRETEYIPESPLPNPPFEPEYANINKTEEVLVQVFMNDKQVFIGACKDREQVRLPSESMGDAWEVRITGQCRVYSIALSETGRGQERV